MSGTLYELRLFFREFRATFTSTGAVLPSGPALARALSRYVHSGPGAGDGPRRILEVGPGTGAVTREIIRAMGPEDRLDLVELNGRFVEYLSGKLAGDAGFSCAADRIHLTHAAVQQLPGETRYDAIVSGLPLNNFTPDLVREIVFKLRDLLAPGGTLSFFEYIAVRQAKSLLCRRAERLRLAQIGDLLDQLLGEHEVHRDRVLANVPPAWVHHIQF